MVALVSSSGSHCLSENLSSKLLFPTLEFPINNSLQFIVDGSACFAVGAIVVGKSEWGDNGNAAEPGSRVRVVATRRCLRTPQCRKVESRKVRIQGDQRTWRYQL